MIKIRRATLEDADFIEATYRPFVESHWTSFESVAPDAAEIAQRIAAAEDLYPWLIAEGAATAEEAARPLGYAYASRHRVRGAYQTSVDTAIYCAPEARGKGVGTRLYTRLFELLTRQNYVMAFAGIALPNAASIGVHKSLGFELIGTYPSVGYKDGAWRDTQWWGKRLAEPLSPPAQIRPVSEVL